MVVNNNEQKTSKPQKESALSKFKIRFEFDRYGFKLSESFGKKQPWIVRVWETSLGAIALFFFDLFTALKVIIKGIM